MARLGVLLFLVQIVLAVCALISCLSAEEGKIRALPRIAWVLIILFFPLVGSIAWFIVGREASSDARKGWPGGAASPERQRPRPVAPDDDPEFLRSVQDRAKQQDQELFQRWEEDLRRREDDLRRRDGDPPREGDRPEV
ncbi:PLD nuclease N-terminal domain-containing protein [Micromonospora sp. LAH09]|uniref:PLD nuclease N-terminal domain-containing protein n=1 Tax=Micromonospora cabrerizensis TaxID=2911213 RepID=UPI001EE8F7D1|nr:PLD nuclease N-terminal domain-containing protein [Micromonospora cabrerizensis]MCG5471122.1 PLD nuclease N-terminal domain-containing protein [Micromonospora cabrerizensis]